ncbi:MAG: hypothetical protein HFH14_10025 [Lachnospiraceae bacterium]|nr:hypothetical protein [Lachnospiraceae bacterium]
MNNKNILWYAGYAVSLGLVLLLLFADFSPEIESAIGIFVSVIFSVSHIQLWHNKMLREDNEYRIDVMDERNISIKEKTGNITNMITFVLLGCATVLFIALEYIIPAIIIGVIIFVQPLILFCVSTSIERKM